ncbi:MAG: peptide ABC transporter substrate-binding protein [Actinomycetota bacterium]
MHSSKLPAFLLVIVLFAGCTLIGGSEGADAVPRVGGRLVVAAPAPKSLEPSRFAPSDKTGLLLLKQICEPLVVADPVTGELLPGAAESWEISEDAKTVSFKLRKGMKFHNGTEVVAEDYVFSMSRFAAKDSGSELFFLLDKVAGFSDLRSGKAKSLSGLKAPDAQTLVVELSSPFAEFPAVVSHPAVGSAVPSKEAAKKRFAAKPLCTGPYEVSKRWDGKGNISLVRSEDYIGIEDAYTREGRGYADEILLDVVRNGAAAFEKLTEDAADVAPVPLERLAQARSLKGRVESGANGIVTFVGLPVTKPPFNKAEYRRALALSLDRSEIVEDLLAGSRGLPRGFLPSGAGPVAGEQVCGETVVRTADRAAAQEHFKASKVKAKDVRQKVYFNGGSGHERWLRVVSDQWKRGVGVSSRLTPLESIQHLVDHLVAGSDGPFRWAWLASYPSPESIFGPLFAAKSPDNYSGFSSRKFERLMRKARSTLDDEARAKTYLEAGAVLCEHLPMIPVWFVENHYAFAPGIASGKGARLDATGDPILRELGPTS